MNAVFCEADLYVSQALGSPLNYRVNEPILLLISTSVIDSNGESYEYIPLQ
ncbi:hypothetical protein SAMN02927897_04301 [Kosakonia sacchari]|uniref:Uncharacterized protein n=1 Tax=Kosakonia sacchari TaxID=1158459 RepID=A0A1G4Z9P7_9ENTR|nr:hypothetical protein SAMN02927897_04301 [Kosakonia sacchari]